MDPGLSFPFFRNKARPLSYQPAPSIGAVLNAAINRRSASFRDRIHERHQGSGGHLGPVPCGRPDPALDPSALEAAGGHLEEVWRRSDHREPQENSTRSAASARGLPIPRVDQVLGSLGKGRVFFFFDLVSSLHQIITAHEDPRSSHRVFFFALPRASTSRSSYLRAAVLRPAGS